MSAPLEPFVLQEWRDLVEMQGKLLNAPYTSTMGRRTAEYLNRVVAQFDVERSPRYKKNTRSDGKPSTWCNLFLFDVLNAMGVGIPYMRASAMQDWFAKEGKALGWELCTPMVAMYRASLGWPVVCTYKNPDPQRSGHVAIVVPSRGHPGLWIAQAGLENFSFGLESRSFGRLPVQYFSHP